MSALLLRRKGVCGKCGELVAIRMITSKQRKHQSMQCILLKKLQRKNNFMMSNTTVTKSFKSLDK